MTSWRLNGEKDSCTWCKHLQDLCYLHTLRSPPTHTSIPPRGVKARSYGLVISGVCRDLREAGSWGRPPPDAVTSVTDFSHFMTCRRKGIWRLVSTIMSQIREGIKLFLRVWCVNKYSFYGIMTACLTCRIYMCIFVSRSCERERLCYDCRCAQYIQQWIHESVWVLFSTVYEQV